MTLVVATAGHVDHGKSSLVRALTGVDPDRLAEEKRRGLTIDLGFAHVAMPSGAVVSFVDVPGHTRFLSNMLAGVGGVRACLFVVDASEGWRAQSEEHLRIVELVGVRHAVLALTKCDLVDAGQLAERRAELTARVSGSPIADALVVPVSVITGEGLERLADALDALAVAVPPAADRGRPRLWIDRSFAAKGSGTVVTGTLTDGALQVDAEVLIEPGERRARVRAIESHSARTTSIAPGNRVALNLVGVGHQAVQRGDAVVTQGSWHLTSCFDASFRVLDALTHPVSRRGAYLAYIGSAEVTARLRVLGTDSLSPGGVGSVRLFLASPLPLLPGDHFVIRETGRDETVGGGVVLDVDPIRRASQAAPDGSVERIVAERGRVDVVELERLTGVRVEPTVGRWAVSDPHLAETRDRLLRLIGDSGPAGLDVAGLDEFERSVLTTVDVVVERGRARPSGTDDPYFDHPLLTRLREGGITPEQPDAVDRAVVRELVRRRLVFERDGLLFHVDAIAIASGLARRLLADDPSGFTVSTFRERSGSTRKFAVPLLAELDARGITRRRGDLRIAGPRIGAESPAC